ncbi:gag-pol polyprotein [Tanacetum coccineum]|uniref:Gag-pol polyprotein n=1 Tax=Tanacetum coccineum TaxID=301880 RepID=A0ABQ5AC80_9ASTR
MDSIQQQMPNLDDISDPITTMNMALVLMAKAFKLNYSTPNNNNQRTSSNPRNRQIAQPGINMGQDRQMLMVGENGGNQFRQYVGQNVGQNVVQNPGIQNVGKQNGLIVVSGIDNQNANQNGNGNVVAARAEGNGNGNDKNQVRCYNCRGMGHLARNCTVRSRIRDAAYLQTQLLIAQKEEAGIQLQAEEFYLMAATGDIDEIEEVNANCILMKNLQQASTSGTQTDKAPVYDSDGSAEKNALHLSSAKQITALNEEITNLNNQLSKENSTVSLLQEEKKKLKTDFKTREDELLDKLIQSEKNIKEIDNILFKTGQSIQTMHMLSPKPDSFYHTEQKMALGYQNHFYLKQAQQKQ